MSLSIARHALLIKHALREPIWLAVTVSAALHVGAIAWIMSPDPSPRELQVAGGQVIIEVAMVEGPERHPGADTGEDRDRPSPASAPARAAPQPDRHRATDRLAGQAPDQPADPITDHLAIKPETAVQDEPAPTARPVEAPLPVAPPKPPAVALLQAPPPPPAKPAPPVSTATAPSPPAASQAQTDASDGTDTRTAPSLDGLETPIDDPAHHGGTKGASPRGDNPKPEYPFVARNRGYQGRVVLRVDVLPNGTAGGVELTSSSGYDSLDAAALRTVRQWRFVPARRNGQPVAAAVTVPVLFKLY